MPSRPLPNNPSLEHLRKDAKRLLASVRGGSADALAAVREFHPRGVETVDEFALTDAQLVVARSYGFGSWPRLKAHLAEIEPYVWNPPERRGPRSDADLFVHLACLTYTGLEPSPERAVRILEQHPGLVDQDIYLAAAAGAADIVARTLASDPGLRNRKGGPLHWEPLLYACYSRMPPSHGRSSVEVIRHLLERGADPNAGFLYAGSYAFTALTGAFGRGEDWPNQPPHPDCDVVARLLLGAGADPNDAQTIYNRHFRPENGYLRLLFEYGLGQPSRGPWIRRLNDPLFTPSSLLVVELCAAVQHHFIERVELLVTHGVDVNGRSRRTGRTPYEEAVRNGDTRTAEYLVAHGAQPAPLDPRESFAMACIAGLTGEVNNRLLADPGLLERLGRQGQLEMLHRAVEAHNEAGIRLIVGLGVDINGMIAGSGLDRAVLHNVSGWGPLRLVQLLVELGADPTLRDLTFHASPIGWALYNRNHRAVVDYLLQFATIFDAIQAGSIPRLNELLDADPSLAAARDERGSPLVFRVRPDTPNVDALLDTMAARGIDLNARDPAGRSLADIAQGEGLSEFVTILRAHGVH